MTTIAEMFVGIGADVSDFKTAMKGIKTDLKDVGGDLKGIGMDLATTFGAMGGAIAAGLGLSVKKAADFEGQLSSIKAVSGATGEQMENMRVLALQMGADTKYSGVEAAQGIEELIKAGVSLEDIMAGGLQGALNLATAGELELSDAAEIASTALNAFKADGMSVADAGNILAGAANASATSVSELKFGLSAVAAVASSVGMSFKDTTTALAVFAQNGLKGSDAGTSLKTMLMNLQPQTEKQIGLFQDLGLMAADGTNAFFDANGQLKSLGDISGILQEKLGGLTDQQRLATMETLFGSDAIRAANILFKEGTTGVTNMADAMGKVSAADVAAERMNNLKGRVEELKGAFETAQITIGTMLMPAMEGLTAMLKGVTDWFNNLSPGMQQFIVIGAAVTAGIFLLIAGLGLMLMFVGGVITAVGSITAAFSAMGIAVNFAIWPITLVIAGIVALIAIGVLLYKHWDEIKAGAVSIWGSIAQFFQQTWDWMKNTAVAVWNSITGFLSGVWEGIKAAFVAVWDSVKVYYKSFWKIITTVVNAAWDIIKSIFAAVFLTIYYLVTGEWDKIGEVWRAFFVKVQEITGAAWTAIKEAWSAALTAISGTISRVIETVKAAWHEWFENAKAKAKAGLDAVVNFFTELPGKITATLTDLKNQIGTKFEEMKNAALEFGKDMIRGMVDGIKSMAGALINAAKGVVSDAVAGAKALLGIHSPSVVWRQEVGVNSALGMIGGLNDMAADAERAGASLASAAMGGIDPLEFTGSAGAAGNTTVNNNTVTVHMHADDIEQMQSIYDFFSGFTQTANAMG